MNKSIKVYVLVLFLSQIVLSAVLTFDDITGNGTPWANDRYLVSHEIYFHAVNNGPMYAWDDPSPLYGGEYVAASGLTYIYAGTSNTVANCGFDVIFFDEGNLSQSGVTDFIQFDVVDYAAETFNTWAYYAYDVNGSILLNGSGTGSGQTVTISTGLANIHGFRFLPSRDTEGLDSFIFNNVQPIVENVPEPNSLLLISISFLGLVVYRKKDRV